jgi:hypothetical protein
MRAIEYFTEEAREVVRRLKASVIRDAEALLLTEQGVYPVKGLQALLNNPHFEATAILWTQLPDPLRSDEVYLYPFSDVADAIRAPFGADTIYVLKTRTSNSAKRGRSGV